ncbi:MULTISPECIES: hypothetical protein [Marinobacter]|nr:MULTISPECIES: hypothetical protein [Marinobacter]MCD1632070.1 hypothetical protein [Marinobacter shengliensis]
MSDPKKGNFRDGYVPEKKGWQPQKEPATNGHKPETSEMAPKNPPKKK